MFISVLLIKILNVFLNAGGGPEQKEVSYAYLVVTVQQVDDMIWLIREWLNVAHCPGIQ